MMLQNAGGEWGVCEVVKDGLPIRVVPCRLDAPPVLQFGEQLRWLVVASPVGGKAARRLAREFTRRVGRYAGGAAPWLQTYLPGPAGDFRRPIYRRWPDGRIEHFGSVRAAARMVHRDRSVLKTRLLDGCTDWNGCTWHDAERGPVINRGGYGSVTEPL
jgi:hypothetical protein